MALRLRFRVWVVPTLRRAILCRSAVRVLLGWMLVLPDGRSKFGIVRIPVCDASTLYRGQQRDLGPKIGHGRTVHYGSIALYRPFQIGEFPVDTVEDLFPEADELGTKIIREGQYMGCDIGRMFGDGIDLFFGFMKCVHRNFPDRLRISRDPTR